MIEPAVRVPWIPATPLRALVVEDDPAAARAIVAGFELQGVTACHAGSLVEARAYLDTDRPAIACIDLSLPDGYGLDLVPALEAVGVRYVIVVSGERAHEHVVRGLKGGVFRHFVKPLRLSMLLDAIIEIKAVLASEAADAAMPATGPAS